MCLPFFFETMLCTKDVHSPSPFGTCVEGIQLFGVHNSQNDTNKTVAAHTQAATAAKPYASKITNEFTPSITSKTGMIWFLD